MDNITVDSFWLVAKTQTISVFACPLCLQEFSSKLRVPRSCPRCHYPTEGSEFTLAVKRARFEINQLLKEKGYVLQRSELQPIVELLESDFPKVKRVDVWGELGFSPRDKRVRRERYDLELHQYVEVRRRNKEPIAIGPRMSEAEKRLRETLRKA